MKKLFFLFCFSLLGLLNVSAQTLIPTASTQGNEVWYRIKCSNRYTGHPNSMWLTGVATGGEVITSDYADTDAQRWKVVASGDGFVLVNKAFGNYLNTDMVDPKTSLVHLTSVAAAPTTAVKFIPTTNTPYPPTQGVLVVNTSTVVSPTNVVDQSTITFSLYITQQFATTLARHTSATAGNLFAHSGFFFRTEKEALKDVLNKVQNVYDNSTEGTRPGQFPFGTREGVLASLDFAKEVYNNENATTAQIFEVYTDLSGTLEVFNSQAIFPSLSTDLDEKYYYIQGTRSPANVFMTAPAAGGTATFKNLALNLTNDKQLWKMVANGTGYALQNKATLEYIDADIVSGSSGATLKMKATMPTAALRTLASAENSVKTMRFFVENVTGANAFRLHSGSDGTIWNYTGNANDNCTWLIVPAEQINYVVYNYAKATARTLYNTTLQGAEFGQFSAETRAAFDTAIAAEEAKDASTMSSEEINAGIEALKAATDAFKSISAVKALVATTAYKWFRINSVYYAGKSISSNGSLMEQKFIYEPKDINSDAQLFRFELNAAGTKVASIINKANGAYVSPNGTMVATPVTTNEFDLTALDPSSFAIDPTNTISPDPAKDPYNSTVPLHASGGKISNWVGGAGSASAWVIEYVKSEPITDFTASYLTKRTQTRTLYTTASANSGSDFGQVNATAANALGAVVIAEEAKNAASLTQEQLLQGILDMNAAVDALSINTDVKLLVNNPWSPKWYRLINNQSGTGYASGKVMSSNGRMETEQFTYEDRDITSEAQLFRFELNAEQTKVAAIVNKLTGYYVSAKGSLEKASTPGNMFDITQLAGGRSFWIDPTNTVSPDPKDEYNSTAPLHAAATGTHIVNWLSGAGSASAWIFEYATEFMAVKNTADVQYQIRVKDGYVTVDGVDEFDIYTVLGQKKNNKLALPCGVYVVKVKNFTQKIVVQ